MKRIIQKFGSTRGVCIPQEFMRDLNLSRGDLVDFSIENGKIILTPVRASVKMNEQATNTLTDGFQHVNNNSKQ